MVVLRLNIKLSKGVTDMKVTNELDIENIK